MSVAPREGRTPLQKGPRPAPLPPGIVPRAESHATLPPGDLPHGPSADTLPDVDVPAALPHVPSSDAESPRGVPHRLSVDTLPPNGRDSAPSSRSGSAHGFYPVASGICRHTRRELDADREARIGAKDGFGPSPYHLVHFTDRWVCTSCGNPIVFHFDCVRSLEELDADRAKRIVDASPKNGGSDEDVSVSSAVRPSQRTPRFDHTVNTPLDRSRSPEIASTPALAGSPPPSFSEPVSPPAISLDLPAHGMNRTHRAQPPAADAALFGPDPRYLVHVQGGQWVCSFPSCLQPIDMHRSDPASIETKRKLFHPPVDSTLHVLARFVGRVGGVSPRASARSSVASAAAGPSYATSNAAFLARSKLGAYANTCAVCGYPDKQPFKGYPLPKNKNGVVQMPPVTMAHVLAPDALVQVCYEDDETNYLPLCGTLGWEGSCHDAFDKNLILFAYEGRRRNDGHFMVWASDPLYKHLSGRHVVLANKPHRSALHARARHALTSAQVVETPEVVSEAIVKMWNTEAPDPADEEPASPLFDAEA